MNEDQTQKILHDIEAFYKSIPSPKYRHAELNTLKQKFEQLQGLKDELGHDRIYQNLINAMSQIIAKLEKKRESAETNRRWNMSERGKNKVLQTVLKKNGQSMPVEYTDRWGNACHVSNGHWDVKKHMVMDVLGNMYLLKEGGNRLPKDANPIFNDLFEIQQRENQLNGVPGNVITSGIRRYIRFTDDDFRQFTGLRMNSNEIKTLLLETARVEFKLTFPVRLKSTGSKENTHRMNYYSRFFEIGDEAISSKSNGVVLSRRYTIVFNTLLGELFVNNLLAKYNDQIDNLFYQLPESAQNFYRKELVHISYTMHDFYLTTIAEHAGLTDHNPWNLAITVETSILQPLIENGYIDSYEKIGADPKTVKYVIKRSQSNSKNKSRDVVGSVKDVAGSVKDVVGSVKS